MRGEQRRRPYSGRTHSNEMRRLRAMPWAKKRVSWMERVAWALAVLALVLVVIYLAQ